VLRGRRRSVQRPSFYPLHLHCPRPERGDDLGGLLQYILCADFIFAPKIRTVNARNTGRGSGSNSTHGSQLRVKFSNGFSHSGQMNDKFRVPTIYPAACLDQPPGSKGRSSSMKSRDICRLSAPPRSLKPHSVVLGRHGGPRI